MTKQASNAQRAIRAFLLLFIAFAFGVLTRRFADTGSIKVRSVTVPLYSMPAEVAAYCPCNICCGDFSDGITASGSNAYQQGIAADTRAFPYGTVILVPGYGEATVDDTGSAVRNAMGDTISHIEVRFQSHEEALLWGRKLLTVLVKREKER